MAKSAARKRRQKKATARTAPAASQASETPRTTAQSIRDMMNSLSGNELDVCPDSDEDLPDMADTLSHIEDALPERPETAPLPDDNAPRIQYAFRVDQALRDAFSKTCRRNDTTASQELRRFMRDYVRQNYY